MDLDGDGRLDLISGSWPGELFLFRGGPDRTFAAPEMIQDKNGDIINIGGGISEQPGGGILIRGTVKWDETPDGWIVTYRGKEYRSTPERSVSSTGTASAVYAADWDGDGDYDLLVGDIGGSVYLVPNEGTAQKYAFGEHRRLEADGKPLHVAGDAGPFVIDWDGDRDLDLLVGAGDGSVSLFRNLGGAKSPELAAAEQLVGKAEASFGAAAPKEPRRGMRSKVCAADWNGDGRLDLLVGDFTTQKPVLPEPTPEQKAEQDKAREELKSIQTRFSELIGKLYGDSRVKDKEEREKAEKEFKEIRQRMDELQSKLPREYDTHGWVWLFLSKPTDGKASER